MGVVILHPIFMTKEWNSMHGVLILAAKRSPIKKQTATVLNLREREPHKAAFGQSNSSKPYLSISQLLFYQKVWILFVPPNNA